MPPSDLPSAAEPADEKRRSLVFPPQPQWVSLARYMVTTALGEWRLDHLRDDAELLVSELATNAIQHALDENPIRLTIEMDRRWLSLSTRGRSVGTPRTAKPTTNRERGRGLLLIEHIAGSWHCEANADGSKTVSCRLALWAPDLTESAVQPPTAAPGRTRQRPGGSRTPRQ